MKKHGKNTIITRADKGSASVIMDKADSIERATTLHVDTNTHVKIKKNPTKEYQKSLNTLIDY